MSNLKEKQALDCHIHLWDSEKFHYPWPPPELQKICRPFRVSDLQVVLQHTSVKKAVFIQVNQSYIETDWILEEAAKSNLLAGVVGWVDLQDPELDTVLDKYMQHKKFKGVRNILEAEPDDWLARESVQRGLGILQNRGLSYDLLVRPRHLKLANEVVKKFPRLKFVVDHIAKPLVKEGKMDGWREGITELATNPNVYCKISGIVTEADHENWSVEDLKPYVQHVLKEFGVDRCMFGSDWPVLFMASESYTRVYEAYMECLNTLSDKAKQQIFCENGANFYNLELD